MRVFLVCTSAYCTTGGIEAVHQLIEQLNIRNIDTYLFYWEKEWTMKEAIPDIYKKYGAKVVSEFLDAEDSVFIVPETLMDMRHWCIKGQVAIWWLSVDNACAVEYQRLRNENIVHLVQSFYAKKYLSDTLGVESIYLSDYLSSTITEFAKEHRESFVRKDVCLYNPSKGAERVAELVARTNNRFEWIPITGMSPLQVAELMCKSKVYIDFGNHPGKDRIPREAAYCGCCILTNKRGSAAFAEDVAIPEKYKFSNEEDYEKIIDQIEYMIHNYETVKQEFYPYVEKIKCEKAVFEKEVEDVIKVLKQRTSHKNEKSIEVRAVSDYLQMMNQELDTLKNINCKVQELIGNGFYEQSVDILLKEEQINRQLHNEIWEILRYLA